MRPGCPQEKDAVWYMALYFNVPWTAGYPIKTFSLGFQPVALEAVGKCYQAGDSSCLSPQ